MYVWLGLVWLWVCFVVGSIAYQHGSAAWLIGAVVAAVVGLLVLVDKHRHRRYQPPPQMNWQDGGRQAVCSYCRGTGYVQGWGQNLVPCPQCHNLD
jgi:uncharacterized paraquat-inducible protein A